MPYIMPGLKLYLDSSIDGLLKVLNNEISDDKKEGCLNYVISRVLSGTQIVAEGLSYKSLNAKIGILECAKLELYRRIGASYEESMKIKNGDIQEYHDLDVYIDEKFSTKRT